MSDSNSNDASEFEKASIELFGETQVDIDALFGVSPVSPSNNGLTAVPGGALALDPSHSIDAKDFFGLSGETPVQYNSDTNTAIDNNANETGTYTTGYDKSVPELGEEFKNPFGFIYNASQATNFETGLPLSSIDGNQYDPVFDINPQLVSVPSGDPNWNTNAAEQAVWNNQQLHQYEDFLPSASGPSPYYSYPNVPLSAYGINNAYVPNTLNQAYDISQINGFNFQNMLCNVNISQGSRVQSSGSGNLLHNSPVNHYNGIPQAQRFDDDAENLTERPASRRSSRSKGKNMSRTTSYRLEKPKKDPAKPHVRINASTKGTNSRPSKTNNYRGTDFYDEGLRHPFGNMVRIPKVDGTGIDEFNFLESGEFRDINYDADVLENFILNHPRTSEGNTLCLWVQKGPSDSARRYESQYHSKCRMRNCPQSEVKYTIGVGDFRVAFDQHWTTYGGRHDPMLVAGYIHLDCAERFLNWPLICQYANVQADCRALPLEPNGINYAAVGKPRGKEASEIREFIRHCQASTLPQMYSNYPTRFGFLEDRFDQYKAFRNTLTYKLTCFKVLAQHRSKILWLINRGLKPTVNFVHRGDEQMKVDAKFPTGPMGPSDPQPRKVVLDRIVEDLKEQITVEIGNGADLQAAFAGKWVAPGKRERDDEEDDNDGDGNADDEEYAPRRKRPRR